MKQKSRWWLVGLVLVLVLAACGQSGGVPEPQAVEPIQLEEAVSAQNVCAGVMGGIPRFALSPSQIASAQTPGQRFMGIAVGRDLLLAVIRDAPGLPSNMVRLRIDLDPAAGVTWDKAIEFRSFCGTQRLGVIVAKTIQVGFGEALLCNPLSAANDFRSGCTISGTAVLEPNSTSTQELTFTKPGFLGYWHPVFTIDQTFWQAFRGRDVRFIWRRD